MSLAQHITIDKKPGHQKRMYFKIAGVTTDTLHLERILCMYYKALLFIDRISELKKAIR